ncbi:MAG: ferritin-like domain-containing protein [Polyangiales bacterium]
MRSDLAPLRARFLAAMSLAAASACTSTVASSDASTADAVTPTDTLTPTDVPRADVVTPTDTVTPTDAGAATDGAIPPPTCAGRTAQAQCFSRAALEQMLRFPGGGPASDAGLPVDAGYAPNGCMQPEFAQNSCCNRAQSQPWVQGDECCYWFCEGACCGRALLVEGAAQLPDTRPDAAWCAPLGASSVDPSTARALAAAWRDDARMEHASIASFARATLSLLALGAPPALLAETQQAGLDEVHHAARCFALAARYDHAPLGPAPLDLALAAPQDLAAFACDTLRAGCIGESVAAVTASAQRDAARDPAVREALARITDDETAHASLAWRTLAWCLQAGGAPVRRALLDAWRSMSGGAQLGPFDDVPAGVDRAAWRDHGRLDAATRAAVARRVWREVVTPCVEAALDVDAA